MNYQTIIPFAITLVGTSLLVFGAQTHVLTGANLEQWESKEFSGQTHYEPVVLEGKTVIRAHSQGGASGRFLERDIDLDATPYLNWRWRVENRLSGNAEREKSGDDYPARLYVVVSGGVFFWKTKAVNYVWSSQQTAETHWPNAFTSNAQMVAVRGPEAPLGQWQVEKRNVKEDFKKLFGSDIKEINAIAFMTDTDNTGQQASAYYGEIYFSSE